MPKTSKRIRLKDLRNDYNLSQASLAEKTGVSQAFLSSIEKGKRGIPDKLRNILLEEFHVDNLEDYEIEIEKSGVTNYSFDNKGQLTQGRDIDNPILRPEAIESKNGSSTLEVMSLVIQDYRKIVEILKEELKDVKEENKQLLENVAQLKNLLSKSKK